MVRRVLSRSHGDTDAESNDTGQRGGKTGETPAHSLRLLAVGVSGIPDRRHIRIQHSSLREGRVLFEHSWRQPPPQLVEGDRGAEGLWSEGPDGEAARRDQKDHRRRKLDRPERFRAGPGLKILNLPGETGAGSDEGHRSGEEPTSLGVKGPCSIDLLIGKLLGSIGQELDIGYDIVRVAGHASSFA
jgi:hypothetical protein